MRNCCKTNLRVAQLLKLFIVHKKYSNHAASDVGLGLGHNICDIIIIIIDKCIFVYSPFIYLCAHLALPNMLKEQLQIKLCDTAACCKRNLLNQKLKMNVLFRIKLRVLPPTGRKSTEQNSSCLGGFALNRQSMKPNYSSYTTDTCHIPDI